MKPNNALEMSSGRQSGVSRDESAKSTARCSLGGVHPACGHASLTYLVVVVALVAWVLAGFLVGAGVVGFVAGLGFAGGAAEAADLDEFSGVRVAALFTIGWVAACAGAAVFGLAFTIRCCGLGATTDEFTGAG